MFSSQVICSIADICFNLGENSHLTKQYICKKISMLSTCSKMYKKSFLLLLLSITSLYIHAQTAGRSDQQIH